MKRLKKNGSIRKKGIPQPENYLATLWQYNEASISDRIKRISETENRVNGLMSKIGKIEPKIDEKVNKSKDSIITLTVTVLGIFTSITFSLTGSLSLLSNILNESNSFAEALFKYSLIGIFVANLIFLLLYIVSKMNNKSIAMHCSLCKDISYICQNCNVRTSADKGNNKYGKQCHGCEHRNISCQECTKFKSFRLVKVFCKLLNKFYYISLINILCIVILIFSCILGVTGHNNFVFENKEDVSVSQNRTSEEEPEFTKSCYDERSDEQQENTQTINATDEAELTNENTVVDDEL